MLIVEVIYENSLWFPSSYDPVIVRKKSEIIITSTIRPPWSMFVLLSIRIEDKFDHYQRDNVPII